MPKLKLLIPRGRERSSSPNRILDLSPIHIPLRQNANLLGCDRPNASASTGNRSSTTRLAQESPPNHLLALLRKVCKVQSDMDPRQERIVKGTNAICREEEDPAIILNVPQEHSDHRVPLEVMQAPLLQKNISFVDEDNRFPCSRDIKDRLQFGIKE